MPLSGNKAPFDKDKQEMYFRHLLHKGNFYLTSHLCLLPLSVPSYHLPLFPCLSHPRPYASEISYAFSGLPKELAAFDCNRCTLTYFCISGLVICVCVCACSSFKCISFAFSFSLSDSLSLPLPAPPPPFSLYRLFSLSIMLASSSGSVEEIKERRQSAGSSVDCSSSGIEKMTFLRTTCMVSLAHLLACI